MNFSEYVFSAPYLHWLISGAQYTIIIAGLTSIVSLIIGCLVCFLHISKQKLYHVCALIYINIFRNIPPLPFLLFLVFGLPGIYTLLTGNIFPRNTVFMLLILGISLNTAAYLAEIFRSGLKGVPKSTIDSARVLGLKPSDIRLHILLPQALRISFPALGTRLIHNMKNASIALVLPLDVNHMEVMGQAGRIAGQTFTWAEPLIFAASVYLVLTMMLQGVITFFSQGMQKKIVCQN